MLALGVSVIFCSLITFTSGYLDNLMDILSIFDGDKFLFDFKHIMVCDIMNNYRKWLFILCMGERLKPNVKK